MREDIVDDEACFHLIVGQRENPVLGRAARDRENYASADGDVMSDARTLDLFTPSRPVERTVGTAHFSNDGRYRYDLTRMWDRTLPYAVCIGLNPSKAGVKTNDATIRRLLGFANRWGCGGIVMLNLFAWVETHAHQLADAADPVGLENDLALDLWLRPSLLQPHEIRYVVAMWGACPSAKIRAVYDQRVADVLAVVAKNRDVWSFGKNIDGSPKHPVRLAYTTPLSLFTPKGAA